MSVIQPTFEGRREALNWVRDYFPVGVRVRAGEDRGITVPFRDYTRNSGNVALDGLDAGFYDRNSTGPNNGLFVAVRWTDEYEDQILAEYPEDLEYDEDYDNPFARDVPRQPRDHEGLLA